MVGAAALGRVLLLGLGESTSRVRAARVARVVVVVVVEVEAVAATRFEWAGAGAARPLDAAVFFWAVAFVTLADATGACDADEEGPATAMSCRSGAWRLTGGMRLMRRSRRDCNEAHWASHWARSFSLRASTSSWRLAIMAALASGVSLCCRLFMMAARCARRVGRWKKLWRVDQQQRNTVSRTTYPDYPGRILGASRLVERRVRSSGWSWLRAVAWERVECGKQEEDGAGVPGRLNCQDPARPQHRSRHHSGGPRKQPQHTQASYRFNWHKL